MAGGTSGLRVLASSCPQNRTYYAAAQVLKDGVGGDVFAIVCKVLWNPRSTTGEQFGYKDMEETMGPCEAQCPASILALLTPTTNPHALAWRKRCADAVALRRRRVAHGDRVRLDAPLTFADGHVGAEFIVERHGRALSFRRPDGGPLYHISRFHAAWLDARSGDKGA